MRGCWIAIAAAANLAASAAAAAEICESQESAPSAGSMRLCVSSVLAPQAGRDYGPRNLMGTIEPGGAWCEGVPGPGIGERITIHMKPPTNFRSISITNGYARTEDTFRHNGRIKRALIETNRGFKREVTLKDSREEQKIALPGITAGWVRLTIVEVYPGSRGTDTCVTEIGIDYENSTLN